MITNAMMVAASAAPKTRVTIRPEVVRWLSIFIHESAPALAVAEKQSNPGAQEAVEVVVAEHVDVPEVV